MINIHITQDPFLLTVSILSIIFFPQKFPSASLSLLFFFSIFSFTKFVQFLFLSNFLSWTILSTKNAFELGSQFKFSKNNYLLLLKVFFIQKSFALLQIKWTLYTSTSLSAGYTLTSLILPRADRACWRNGKKAFKKCKLQHFSGMVAQTPLEKLEMEQMHQTFSTVRPIQKVCKADNCMLKNSNQVFSDLNTSRIFV